MSSPSLHNKIRFIEIYEMTTKKFLSLSSVTTGTNMAYIRTRKETAQCPKLKRDVILRASSTEIKVIRDENEWILRNINTFTNSGIEMLALVKR